MSVTMYDIARLAGVSLSTVSRVVNGAPGVREETRRQVMEVIERLDFHPSSFARVLATKRTRMLGLAVPGRRGVSDPFYLHFVAGVADAACASGYRLVLAQDDSESVFQLVNERVVDGMFIMDVRTGGDERIYLMKRSRTPFVVLGTVSDPDCTSADIAHREATHEATSHLAGLGHKRIAFIGGPPNLVAAHLRYEGYRDALTDCGIAVDRDVVAHGDYTEASGHRCILEILQRSRDFTAVLCASDAMAIGAMDEMRKVGIAIPGEVSVVGFDNIPMAAYTDPPLTTVHFDAYEFGKLSAEMLVRLVEDKDTPPSHAVLPTSLIVRSSTAEPQISA